MRSKKLLSVCLIVCMFFVSISSVFATADVAIPVPIGPGMHNINAENNANFNLNSEEVLLKAKKYIKEFFNFEVTDNFQANVNSQEDWNKKGTFIWNVYLYQHHSTNSINLNVTISDDNGDLLSIQKYHSSSGRSHIAKITRDEAKDIADEFLKTHNSGIIDSLFQDSSYDPFTYMGIENSGLMVRDYFIFYPRHDNGIPVANDGVQIGVNSGTGEVSSYRIIWNEDFIPENTAIVTTAEAEKIIKDNITLGLRYVPVRDNSNPYGSPVKNVIIAYSPEFIQGSFVDATTGNFINPIHQPNVEQKEIDISLSEKANLSKPAQNYVSEMNRNEAISFARQVLDKLFGEMTVTFNNISYNSNPGFYESSSGKTWTINFSIQDTPMYQGHLTIDAITRKVITFNNQNWYYREMLLLSGEKVVPTLSWEEGYKKAIDVLSTLYPDKVMNVETKQTFNTNTIHYNDKVIENPEYLFSFTRKENDIPFHENQIYISIDSSTGNIQRIHYRWDEVTLPKPVGLITKEDALNLYINQLNVELFYASIQANPLAFDDRTLKLVYRYTPIDRRFFQNVNASSGEFLDFYGLPVTLNGKNTSTVKELLAGHIAERELSIMQTTGVIDFNLVGLKDVITKNEIIKILVRSLGYHYYYGNMSSPLLFTDVNQQDEYYQYIQMAAMLGFIENEETRFSGYDTVTREELAAMLTKIARLEKIAQIQKIFVPPLKDIEAIDEKLLGHVAIMYGLGIMSDIDGSFMAKDFVTYEDAASAIYRTFYEFGFQRY